VILKTFIQILKWACHFQNKEKSNKQMLFRKEKQSYQMDKRFY